MKLDGHQLDPEYIDPRNCLVFWARPTQKIKDLIAIIQQKLKTAAPDLWLMPLPNLHMTVLEVTHSRTVTEIDDLVAKLLASAKQIADYPSTPNHHTRLIKPMLSYDTAALALSFVPAASEAPTPTSTSTSTSSSDTCTAQTPSPDSYTYHHLRRDLHTLTNSTIPISPRYTVPSAHLTIARFNSPNPFTSTTSTNPTTGPASTKSTRETWIKHLESINTWLETTYWPQSSSPPSSSMKTTSIPAGGEWLLSSETGLDIRKGTLWYGGGETVYLGRSI